MTAKELVNQYCEFRGKCTTDDVVALNFAYEMLAPHLNAEEVAWLREACSPML